jgi:hypothetical protein
MAALMSSDGAARDRCLIGGGLSIATPIRGRWVSEDLSDRRYPRAAAARRYGPAVVVVTRAIGILANWGALGLLSRNLR